MFKEHIHLVFVRVAVNINNSSIGNGVVGAVTDSKIIVLLQWNIKAID